MKILELTDSNYQELLEKDKLLILKFGAERCANIFKNIWIK